MKKIDFYILKNITSNFIISFIITTFIMIIGNTIKIYDLLFAKGVSITLMGKIFWDMVVFLSIFTVPMSLTIAINFVYTELSNNSEITALRSCGVSLKRLYLPSLIFTVLIFFMLFYDISFLSYKTKLSYKINITQAFKNKIYVGLKQKEFYTGLQGTTLYAQKISPDKKTMYNVFYAKNNSVITAKEAHFQDAVFGVIINFTKAHIYSKKEGVIEYGTTQNYKIAVSIDSETKSFTDKNDTRFMDLSELIAFHNKTHNREALYKINKMFVLSLSVFVLSMIGFAFGIIFARSGKSAGIAISLSIFFIFYILEMLGESIFKNYGIIWTIWLPDLILFIFASYIFYKKSTN